MTNSSYCDRLTIGWEAVGLRQMLLPASRQEKSGDPPSPKRYGSARKSPHSKLWSAAARCRFLPSATRRGSTPSLVSKGGWIGERKGNEKTSNIMGVRGRIVVRL